jgi:hypothetical protein
MMQAIAGVQDAQYRCEDPPVFVNLPVAGYAQGIMAANATVATLLARARSGAGDQFEVSGVAHLRRNIACRRPGVMRRQPHKPRGIRRTASSAAPTTAVRRRTAAVLGSLAVALDSRLLVDEVARRWASHGRPRELARRVVRRSRTGREGGWILERTCRAPRSREVREAPASRNNMLVDVDDPALGTQMNVPVTAAPGRAGRRPRNATRRRSMHAGSATRHRPGRRARFDGKPPLDGVPCRPPAVHRGRRRCATWART